jgi:hypothetical protein
MRTCVRCHKVRFWWRFMSRWNGMATEVLNVCWPCGRELAWEAAAHFHIADEQRWSRLAKMLRDDPEYAEQETP